MKVKGWMERIAFQRGSPYEPGRIWYHLGNGARDCSGRTGTWTLRHCHGSLARAL